MYSRVHISSDDLFSKILKRPSSAEINDTLYDWAACFHWDEAKIQNGRHWKKQAKNAFFVFLGCFWAYVRQRHENFIKKYWELAEWKMSFFSVGHFKFLCRPFWFFFLLHLSGKSSPFIWGIIYFCIMDVFSRILEKKLSELLCREQ